MIQKNNSAIKILKNSGIIIYPTETVYGLGADIFNERAVNKLIEIKGRENTKEISIAMLEYQIEEYAEVNELASELIEKYLPGPLTLVLKKKEKVPGWITSTEFVGIRVPETLQIKNILREFGPITSTSANLSGQPAPTTIEEIPGEIKNKVDLILDDGKTKYSGQSTVVKVTDKVEVLRKGVLDIWTQKS